ncbi:MAG: class I SAM-dependent methyltransferase [Paracoccaceae bacterium]
MTAFTNEITSVRPEARFWDRIANSYAKKPISDEASYQRKLDVTQRYLDADMNVLEFGCGTGSTALCHAPQVKHIRSIDISPKMIEIAQEKAKSRQVQNVSFEVGTLDDVDVPTESFDAVLGMSILHLLQDRDGAMLKVHHLLKPGGVFISSTACLGDNMKYFAPIAYLGRLLRLLPLVRVFTSSDLKASLTSAGFNVEYEWCPGKNKGVFIVARKPG